MPIRLLLFVLIIPYLVCAQDLSHLKFTTYTTREGLPSNSIFEVTYDGAGYVWIRHVSVLSRFDGVRFTTFTWAGSGLDSTGNETFSTLALDHDGRFWAGGSPGIAWFDETTQKFVRPILSGNTRLTDVGEIRAGGRNLLWILDSQGLKKLDTGTMTCDSTRLPATGFSSIHLDAAGKIWLADFRNKVYGYDPQTENFQEWTAPGPVNAITSDKSGAIWLGSTWQLYLLHPRDGRFEAFSPPADIRHTQRPFSITDMAFCPEWTGDSLLWLTTFNDGLAVFNTVRRRFVHIIRPDRLDNSGISSQHTTRVKWNSKGLLWISTQGGGLCKLDLQDQEFKTTRFPFAEELFDADIHDVVASGQNPGTWWVATGGKGILQYDPARKKVVRWLLKPAGLQEMPADKDFWSVYEDPSGILWAGGMSGLWRMDRGNLRRVALQHAGKNPIVTQILPSRQSGEIWLLTGQGPCLFNIQNNSYRFYPIPVKLTMNLVASPFREMWEASDGTLWIASIKGLYSLDPQTGTTVHFAGNSGEGHMNAWINRLEPGAPGQLYLATINGVFRFDLDSKQFEAIPIEPLTPGNICQDLHFDKTGKLWVFATNGIIRYDPDIPSATLVNTTAGYVSASFLGEQNVLQMVDGRVFLVKDGNALTFDPLHVDENRYPAAPVITGFKVRNQPYPISPGKAATTAVVLPYHQNFLTFDFSSINFTQPDRAAFSYILEGFVEEWTAPGAERAANYTNLPPGSYTFKVNAANSAGIWSEQPAVIKIRIRPPFWATWWFLTTAGLVFITGIFLFFRSRVKKIRRQAEIREREAGYRQREAELQREVAEFSKQVAEVELAALRAQMNPHFVFNCLNSINTFILLNDPQNASGYLNKFSKLIRRVLDASRAEYITLRDELDTLRYYIELEQMRYGGKFEYRIQTQDTLDTGAIELPPMLVQPYVENAIWHGLMHRDLPGGLLKIDILKEGQVLKIRVEDNGVGRKKAAELKSRSAVAHKSHGIQVINERLQIINELYGAHATAEIEDLFDPAGLATGVRVTLSLPLKMD